MTPRINPSILSCDFANFEHSLARIASADMAHVDVMDNHFVPNLTFGLPVVRRLQQVTPVPLDVHLMIDDPDRWAVGYAEAGCASVTFHVEAAADPIATARRIRAAGAKVGIAVRPGTAVTPLLAQLDEFDQVLIMTVEPGFGGQAFMPEMMPKLHELADAATGFPELSIQVDGGITVDTIGAAARHGANCFVAGSAVFGTDDPAQAIVALRAAAADR